MRAITSVIVSAVLFLGSPVVSAQQALARDVETAAFKQLAAAIPPGSRVRVRTTDGRRLAATLMAVEEQRVVVKRLSRVPEPAVAIAFGDLAELRREEKG